jgi:hypothetical protein
VHHPRAAAKRRFDLALLDAGLGALISDASALTRKVVLFLASESATVEERLRSNRALGLIRDTAPEPLLAALSRYLSAPAADLSPASRS